MDALIRLTLLVDDASSARFAFDDYVQAKTAAHRLLAQYGNSETAQELNARGQETRARLFHHAKTFVVTARRFGRLLEAVHAKRQDYPPAVVPAIRLAWRSSCATLEPFRHARNAVEHIDGEITGANRRFLNLFDDKLEVIPGRTVAIAHAGLAVIEAAAARITDAVCAPLDAHELVATRASFVRLLVLRMIDLEFECAHNNTWSSPA